MRGDDALPTSARLADARFLVVVRRETYDPRLAHASLKKAFWQGPGRGTHTRAVADVWTDCSGLNENESLAAVLLDLSHALTDRWYRP